MFEDSQLKKVVSTRGGFGLLTLIQQNMHLYVSKFSKKNKSVFEKY